MTWHFPQPPVSVKGDKALATQKKALRYNGAQYIGGIFVANCTSRIVTPMMRIRPQFPAYLLLALSLLLFGVGALADEYSEVAQLSKDGKYSEAVAKADYYLSNKPKDANMRLLKGLAQRDAGKTNEAISTFTRLSEDFPELPEPLNNLGVLYADQNQLEKARIAFESALRTNPSYAVAHENLADVYGRLSSAAYTKALQLELNTAAVAPKLALVRQIVSQNPTKLSMAQIAAMNKQMAQVAAQAPQPAPEKTTMALAKPTPDAPSTPAAKPSAATIHPPPAPVPVAVARKPAEEPPAAATPAKPAPLPNAIPPENREVEQAIQSWANAWSAKDLPGYFQAYGKDFAPPGGISRNQWEAERRVRIEGKSKISVKVVDVSVQMRGNVAVARFHQDYHANGIAIASRKTLELSKQGSSWKIVREAVGG